MNNIKIKEDINLKEKEKKYDPLAELKQPTHKRGDYLRHNSIVKREFRGLRYEDMGDKLQSEYRRIERENEERKTEEMYIESILQERDRIGKPIKIPSQLTLVKISDTKYWITGAHRKIEIYRILYHNPLGHVYNFHVPPVRSFYDIVNRKTILLPSAAYSMITGICLDIRYFATETTIFNILRKEIWRGYYFILSVAERNVLKEYIKIIKSEQFEGYTLSDQQIGSYYNFRFDADEYYNYKTRILPKQMYLGFDLTTGVVKRKIYDLYYEKQKVKPGHVVPPIYLQ